MTVKNGQEYLKQSIETVRWQSLRNLELVIVDDGSTDATLGILREYAATDPRIKVVESGGVGRSRALNMALKECSAPYVANLDADDLSHPDRLKIQLDTMQKNEGYALISCACLRIWNDSKPHWEDCPAGCDRPVRSVNAVLPYRCIIPHSGIMAKRDALLSVGGYNTKRNSVVDYELWVRLASNGYSLGILQRPLAAKRLHDNQSFERGRRLRYLLSVANVRAQAIRRLDCSPLAWLNLVSRLGFGLMPAQIRLRLGQLVRRAKHGFH